MKASIYITKQSLAQFERQANKLIKEVNEGKTKILGDQAKLVRDRIREKAPMGPPTDKKPGSLKKAAYSAVIPPSMNGPAVAFAGIRPRKAPHAHLVEFGHGGPHPAPPHPFVRPAWDGVKDEVRNNIANALGKTVEGAV